MKTVARLFLVCFLINLGAGAAPPESPAQQAARLSWWRDARFGMFIHWGPVSLTGEEISWSRANSNPKCPNRGNTPVSVYDNLYHQFNPTNFDAGRWARVAKSAGMKYMILTAKHCDGFLLWHSQVDGYNISATPFRRDVCGELTRAARRNGLRIGWYFSPMDWRDPDFRTERNAAFVVRMQGEVRELLANYGRIDLLWFDWDGHEPLYDQASTYAMVWQLQPQIIIDNRLDLGPGDSDDSLKGGNADYYTPEQRIGRYDQQRPWEACMTLGTQWSWKPNDKIKSASEVLSILARTVGGDGNLLLNVGPMPDGRIEPRQVQVLEEVGAWLHKNGASIYGTRGGPFKPGQYGASTRKGKTIFIHGLNWSSGRISLPPIPARIIGSRTLHGDKVGIQQTESGIELTAAPGKHDVGDTVVALEVDKDAITIPPVDVPSPVQSSR